MAAGLPAIAAALVTFALVWPAGVTAGEARPGLLADGIVVHGRQNIAAAWLTGATDRYRHGALGDAIEASGMAAELADGRRLSLELDAGSVFEDRYPRLADLDGDGTDEILVVHSYLDRGAALAVLGIVDGGLAILAETPAIGTANRWLNPIGAADFDGDGMTEIAVVRTPHIGGMLMLYRWQDGRLTEAYRQPGFSNHALGTRELGLAAIFDADGDGIADLAVPGADRRSLRVVSFAGGMFRELARTAHATPIVSAIVAAPLASGAGLTYSLADGSTATTAFPR